MKPNIVKILNSMHIVCFLAVGALLGEVHQSQKMLRIVDSPSSTAELEKETERWIIHTKLKDYAAIQYCWGAVAMASSLGGMIMLARSYKRYSSAKS